MDLLNKKISSNLACKAEVIVGESLVVTKEFKNLASRVYCLFNECEELLLEYPENEILKHNYNELFILQLLMMVGEIEG